MKAEIEIACENPELIINSLKPELTKGFNVDLKAEGNKLLVVIQADRIPILQAGINSYLRLIKTIIETSNID